MKDRFVARRNVIISIIFSFLLCTMCRFYARLGKAHLRTSKEEGSPISGVSFVAPQDVDYCTCLESFVTPRTASAAYCVHSSPEYIFFVFYVDGNFLKLTSSKFSGSPLDPRKSEKNERVPTAAKMISQLWESIARVHLKSCLVIRTNNEHLFNRKRGILVIDSGLSAFSSYTSTKIAAQIEFYNLLQRNLIKKEANSHYSSRRFVVFCSRFTLG